MFILASENVQDMSNNSVKKRKEKVLSLDLSFQLSIGLEHTVRPFNVGKNKKKEEERIEY